MKEQTLTKQLATLVDSFGYENVSKNLRAIKQKKLKAPKRSLAVKIASCVSARKKPTAVAVVESLKLDDDKKCEFLLHLAQQYDAKQFMPDIGQARMFLENENIFTCSKNSRIKSRQQATVRIFKKMAGMSIDELREMEYCGLYDTPKRLETYARAIENFGRSRRQNQ